MQKKLGLRSWKLDVFDRINRIRRMRYFGTTLRLSVHPLEPVVVHLFNCASCSSHHKAGEKDITGSIEAVINLSRRVHA